MAHSVSQTMENTKVRQDPDPTAVSKDYVNAIWLHVKSRWKAIGVDGTTALTMLKGTLPPIIGIAIYQTDVISSHFGTMYDTIPVISILCLCTMPRAMFLHSLVLNIICLAIGCCMAFLGLYASIRARNHTENLRAADGYNSSASVVSALFLISNIYAINSLRAKFPSLQFPAINYGIFINIMFTYTPLAPSWSQGVSFIGRLTESFLLGYALAAMVSLLIFPRSVRAMVFKGQLALLTALKASMFAPVAIVDLVGNTEMFASMESNDADVLPERNEDSQKKDQSNELIMEEKAAILSTVLGRIRVNMLPAKREWAWGKLDGIEMDNIYGHLRAILIPTVSLSTISGKLNATTDLHQEKSDTEIKTYVERERKVWLEALDNLRKTFGDFSVPLSSGLEHVGILLKLDLHHSPLPKTRALLDVVPTEIVVPSPGSLDFAKYLEGHVSEFLHSRTSRLQKCIEEYSVTVQRPITSLQNGLQRRQATEFDLCRQRLFVILYLDHLMHCTGLAILNFVNYADYLSKSATFSQARVILPNSKTSVQRSQKFHTVTDSALNENLENGSQTMPINHTIQPHNYDIEHLEATNKWQKFGNSIRTIPRFLRSPESLFGFRVACATLSVGIVAFLHQSQIFFREQRLVWAMITVAIGMGWTTGQSAYTLLARIVSFILMHVSFSTT